MDVAHVHDLLEQRAFLHNDPEAYRAGVDDALRVLTDDLVQIWLDSAEDATETRRPA